MTRRQQPPEGMGARVVALRNCGQLPRQRDSEGKTLDQGRVPCRSSGLRKDSPVKMIHRPRNPITHA
jgi:hypothetical protein